MSDIHLPVLLLTLALYALAFYHLYKTLPKNLKK